MSEQKQSTLDGSGSGTKSLTLDGFNEIIDQLKSTFEYHKRFNIWEV